jgi:hypothetical protein
MTLGLMEWEFSLQISIHFAYLHGQENVQQCCKQYALSATSIMMSDESVTRVVNKHRLMDEIVCETSIGSDFIS